MNEVGTKPPNRDLRAMGVCVLAALALRLTLWVPVATPDSERFVRQADELAQGQGLLWDGKPTTSLPPGYPLFLAALRLMGVPSDWYSGVNVALGSLTAGILFLVARPAGRRAAMLAALALALNPWLARQCAYVMSETFATWLCAILAWLGSGLRSAPPTRARAALAGALLALVALTAPGTLAFVGLAGLALGWRLRSAPSRAAVLVVAFGTVMVPWQWYCLKNAGQLAAAVVTPTGNMTSGRGHWIRTWLLDESEQAVLWHPERLAEAPARAFRTPEERERLVALATRQAPEAQKRLDAELDVVAAQRWSEDRGRVWGLVAFRAVRLWSAMPSISHLRAEWIGRISWSSFQEDRASVGTRRALVRLSKGLASACLQLVYVTYALGCWWLGARACRRREGWGLAIVVGALVYTLASAYMALGEARRNAPFVLLLLSLAGPRKPEEGPSRDAPNHPASA